MPLNIETPETAGEVVPIERVREFIAAPSLRADGTVTHRADAELGYTPEPVADVPAV